MAKRKKNDRHFSFVRDLLLPLMIIGFLSVTGYLFYKFLVNYEIIKPFGKNSTPLSGIYPAKNEKNDVQDTKPQNNTDSSVAGNAGDKQEKAADDGNNSISQNPDKNNGDSQEQKKPEPATQPENGQVSQNTDKVNTQENNNQAKSKEFYLYLIDIDDNGNLIFKKIKKAVSYTDSPVFAVISALIAYDGADYKNLIPKGTKLKGAWIKNGICYLDFNSVFLNNPYGFKAVEAQIYQVVNTTMQFESIKGVIIYIDGKQRKYFSEEGFLMDIVFTQKNEL